MSTTVIASRLGASLYFAPWMPANLDVEAVTRVAAAHGIDLFDVSELENRMEAIVATELRPAAASRFAADLRQTGLTVRVVNNHQITQSSRLSNAFALHVMVAMFTSPLVFPAILAAVNAWMIMMNGFRLSVVGAPRTRPAVADEVLTRLRALANELPPHVLGPLVANAEVLADEAAADPGGPATHALTELLADLRGDRAQEVAKSGVSLRMELAQAQKAAREVR